MSNFEGIKAMAEFDRTQPRHPIRVVARRTGLQPYLIRAWERRYQAIKPQRTAGRHRLYSDLDVERLNFLRLATEGGRTIGLVAKLNDDELRRLVAEDQQSNFAPAKMPARPWANLDASGVVLASLDGFLRLDAGKAIHLLSRTNADHGPKVTLERVVLPLLGEVERMRRASLLNSAHESVAHLALRHFLTRLVLQPQEEGKVGQVLVVSNPMSQQSELDALLAAAASMIDGWQIVYLGSSLPMEEIALACRQREARALALILGEEMDEGELRRDLENLRQHLGSEIELLVGGGMAQAYEAQWSQVGGRYLESLRAFSEVLARAI